MHSVAPLVLGLFVACLVTLSCNTSDVLIESFESLLLFDPLFMILSRYSFQYVVFKVRGTPQAKLLSANGDGEIRTLDPLLARQVLSQLSYTPMDAGLPSFQRRSLIHLCSVFISISQSLVALPFQVMGLSGLEPPTSRLSGVRSNRLSYKPIESGIHLLSHAVSSIVPSADQVLTVVFGMGTGVPPDRIDTRIL